MYIEGGRLKDQNILGLRPQTITEH